MQQNTSQSEYITELSQQEIGMKQSAFKDSYGIAVKIRGTKFNDKNWDWIKVIQNFRDSLGKNYGLIEYFNDGSDNNTRYVEFEYEDKGELKTEIFNRYVDAEIRMANLMRQRLEGKD